MRTFGRALRAFGRAVGRAVFFVFIVVVSMFPLPVMPIVLAVRKRRHREVAAQIDRRR
jgi:hypothetical protein